MIKKRKKPKSPAINCRQISLLQKLANLTSFHKELRKTGKIQGNSKILLLCQHALEERRERGVYTGAEAAPLRETSLRYKGIL